MPSLVARIELPDRPNTVYANEFPRDGEVFDPEDTNTYVDTLLAIISAIREASEHINKAFCMSIVDRRVDMKFDNECEEYDYWLEQAKLPPQPASAGKEPK